MCVFLLHLGSGFLIGVLNSLFFSQLFTRLMDYGRRHGDHGRLPVTVNVCLEEFCNIGKLVDFKRVLNVCRGSAIFCQIIVQSIPQLQDRYPKTEWEELIGCTDIQICLGCNDVDTATYISKKCGMVTIKVENNQMPLTPLFSPVYTSTRPYSQTKSNMAMQREAPGAALQNAPSYRGRNQNRISGRFQSDTWQPGGNHRGISRSHGGFDRYPRP